MLEIGKKIPNTRYRLDDRDLSTIITSKGEGYKEERYRWHPFTMDRALRVDDCVLQMDGIVYVRGARLT